MKKNLLFILLFITAGLMAQETSFGAKLNGVFTTFNISGDGAEMNNYSEGKPGLSLGLIAEFGLSDNFAIAPELLYSSAGDIFKMSESGASMETKFFLSYLQIPIMAKYYINDSFYLNAGPQIGFLMSADGEYTVTYDGETETDSEDIKDEFNSNDFGFNIGAGYKLESGLFFDFRYTAGLSDIIVDKDSQVKNSALQFGIGYFFN